MILTGKSKEVFEKWYYKEIDYVGLCDIDMHLSQTINALIIEWFDSVGIEIFPVSGWRDTTRERDGIDVEIIYNSKKYLFINNNSRTKATEKAIEKTNEIYNNQNK